MWMKFMSVFLQIVAEMPNLIQTTETAFSGVPGQSGAAKKALVQAGVAESINVYQQVSVHKLTPEAITSINASTSSLIDSTVAIMKTVGMLTKPATSIAPGGAAPPVV